MHSHIEKYFSNLNEVLNQDLRANITKLSELLFDAWSKKKSIYICGNGGSAGNAIHIANDMLYGAGEKNGTGMRIESLSANPAVITCLANDTGYENIFSESDNDYLIAKSGINGLSLLQNRKRHHKRGYYGLYSFASWFQQNGR